MSVNNYTELNRLIEIASESGELHTIDTQSERQEALEVLYDLVNDEDQDTVLIATQAINKLIESKGPLQVNPVFGNNVTDGGNFINLMGLHQDIDDDSQRFDLLTEIPDGSYMSFTVYFSDPGQVLRKQAVFITEGEWNEITAPLREYRESEINNSDQMTFEQSVAGEVEALRQTIANYEIIVGNKAGTANHLGSWFGNFYIARSNRADDDRQQSCINETFSVLQVIHQINLSGLLYHNYLDIEDPAFNALPTHIAPRLLQSESSGGVHEIAFDTWFHGNGHPAYVGLRDEWLELVDSGFQDPIIQPIGSSDRIAGVHRLQTPGSNVDSENNLIEKKIIKGS